MSLDYYDTNQETISLKQVTQLVLTWKTASQVTFRM